MKLYSKGLALIRKRVGQTSRPHWLGLVVLGLGVCLAWKQGYRLHYDLYQDQLVFVRLPLPLPAPSEPSVGRLGLQALFLIVSPQLQDSELTSALGQAHTAAEHNGNPWAGTFPAPLADPAVRELLATRLAGPLAVRYQLSDQDARRLVASGCDFVLYKLYPHLAKPQSPAAARLVPVAAFFIPSFLLK